MIASLTKIIPEWLLLQSLPVGTILRQKKQIEIYRLREIIQGHFEK